jgi:hypothetical protein
MEVQHAKRTHDQITGRIRDHCILRETTFKSISEREVEFDLLKLRGREVQVAWLKV